MNVPVLLLHGALGASPQLEKLKSLLEQSGREVHLLNFSGHGGEPYAQRFGIEQFSEDISQFIRDRHLSEVDIFGYSMGGYVALWLALENASVRKIVTLGTKFDWSPESAAHEVKKMNAEKILERIPAFARLLESRHAPNDWKDLLQKTAAMMLGLGSEPLLKRENLSNLKNPVLVMLGDQDDMADRNFSINVSEWLPHGSFVALENTPHPIEKVDQLQLRDILVEFFN